VTVSVDQRGKPRPGGIICDLGAFEAETGNPVPTAPPQACTFTASLNLFCRSGPGSSVYPDIDEFTAGESAPVVGISEDK